MRWMVEVRQSGGMVRYIGMGERNALPFLRFVGDVYDAGRGNWKNYENCGVYVAAEGAHT